MKIPRIFSLLSFAVVLAWFAFPTPVHAWGCKGHQVIALIAEKYLTPDAKAFVEKLLRENPVDPPLSPYCGGAAPDLFAAASTWADGIRRQHPQTAPWHYINIPRGAPRGDLAQYCGDRGCIIRALEEKLVILKDPHADSSKRAEALRFVIHLVGDLHMPLHASNNNDRGGTCVPVKFFRQYPAGHKDSFSPNLHSIWDVTILDRDKGSADPSQFATQLEILFAAKLDSWRSAGIQFSDWAWESHDLADVVAYGELVPAIPIEVPVITHACTDADQIGERMRALHISVGETYQSKALPLIEERLAEAGIRLALLLNELSSSSFAPTATGKGT